jgi:transposase
MEALSLLENLDIDPAIKAALAAGFQSDLERYQEQNVALETRVRHDGFIIEKLKLELAHLRRIQFGRKSESLKGEQQDLFNDAVVEDIGNLSEEIEALTPESGESKQRKARDRAGRQPFPPHLPVIEYRHELASCTCGRCGQEQIQISEDVTDQLDVEPAKFTVHRHIRPQYACRHCETITAAPIAPALIEGGMATPGLLAWILISKFGDHLPLYRIEQIAARSGVPLAQSTLGDWVGRTGFHLTPLWDRMKALLLARSVLHADESPVQQLAPGKGKTHKAYLWAYCANTLDQGPPLVLFDYQRSRAGRHVREFLGEWRGSLCVDDYSGYAALFRVDQENPVPCIELGCMAHARRKFYDLHAANQSPMAAEALRHIQELYAIEDEARAMTVTDRLALRLEKAVPALAAFHQFLNDQRITAAPNGASAKAINYSLKRWDALTRYATSGDLPIDNTAVERTIRPIAIGRKNWMFVGSERAGKRAAIIQSLIGTAKANGIDPYAWLKNTLECIPVWPNSRIDELLPLQGWVPRSIGET